MFNARSMTLALALFAPACILHAADVPSNLPEGVVAEQGGAQVTLADIDHFAAGIPAPQREAIFASPKRIESIIRGMLAQKQLLAEAHSLRLQDQPAVKVAMQDAADGALIKARTDALRAKIDTEAPDMTELAHERYLSDPSAFSVPGKVDVKHILIGIKDRSDADAKALADKLYAELQEKPDQFDADIKQYSDDPSKTANDGLIPDATSDRYVQSFRDAAGNLTKVGDISAPVKSEFGYHILKLVALTPEHLRPYAEVKDELIDKLHKDYVDRKVQDHLEGVRNRVLDANMVLVKSLTSRYQSAPAAAAGTTK